MAVSTIIKSLNNMGKKLMTFQSTPLPFQTMLIIINVGTPTLNQILPFRAILLSGLHQCLFLTSFQTLLVTNFSMHWQCKNWILAIYSTSPLMKWSFFWAGSSNSNSLETRSKSENSISQAAWYSSNKMPNKYLHFLTSTLYHHLRLTRSILLGLHLSWLM